MAAAPQPVNKQALKHLVPLNGLSHAHFDELVNKSEIKELPAGRFLFREGDRDGLTYFLLSGELALQQGREVKQVLKAGTEEASHPIGHGQPRQWSAKTKSRISVLVVDSGLLDVLLAWDQANSYEVTDIQAEDDEDWMTRMLSSDLFQRLPASNIQQLLMRMEEVQAEAGTRIVSQDAPGDYYYIVKQGVAEVTRKPSSQSKPIRIARLRGGDSFGEEALLSDSPRNANVTMVSDGVLMRLAKADFDALLREPLIEQLDFEQACAQAKVGAQWLDVRLPGEFQNAHLPDSRNLPLAAVRDASAELDPEQRYIVCCDTGTRSVGAAFLLSQRGFSAVVLRGGLNAVPHDQLQRSEQHAPSAERAGAAILSFNGRADDGAGPGSGSGAEARAQASAILEEAERKAEAMRAELKAVQRRLLEREARVEGLEQAIEVKEKELREMHRNFERSEALGEDVQRLRTELEAAQTQLKEQRSQLEQARGDGAEQEQELLLLREQAQEQQTELERLQAERGQESGALETVRAELEQMRQQAQEAEQQFTQQVQAAQAERDQVRAALSEQERSLADAKRRIEELQNDRSADADFALQLQEREQQLTTLQAQLSEAQQRHAEQHTQLEQLQAAQAEAEQARQSSAEQQARIQELEQQLDDGARTLEERAAEVQRARDQVAEAHAQREAEAAELRQRAQTLDETVARLEREREASAGDLQHRIGELEADLEQRAQALAEREQGWAQTEQELADRIETLQRELEAREAALTEQQSVSAAGQTELETLRDQHQAAQSELQQSRARVNELEAGLARAQAAADQSGQAADEQRVANAEKEAQLAAVRADQEQLQVHLTQLREEHQADQEKLQARIRELEQELAAGGEALAERSRLQGELDALRQAHEQLQQHSDAEKQSWKEQRSELEQQRNGLRTELEQARDEAERLRADRDELTRSLTKAEEDQQRRAEELRQLQQERGKLREQVAELESWMVRAERKRDEHERQLDTSKQDLASLREQLTQARSDANVARERAEALQQQLDASDRHEDEHNAQLREEAAAARAEVRSLQERLETTQRQAEQAEQARATQDTEAEALKDELDSLRGELQQVRAQHSDAVEDAAREHDELALHVEALRQEKAQARERMDVAVGAQRDAEAAVRTLESEVGDLRRELEQTQAALAAAQNQASAADGDASSEVASIRDLADQELRAAAAEIDRLKSELEEARQQVRHMETEMELLRDLDGPEQRPEPPVTDFQRQVETRLSEYKRESDAVLESVRQQNRTLQEELQRLQRQRGQDAAPAVRTEAGGQHAGQRRSRWPLGLVLVAALGGAGAWFWQQQAPMPETAGPGATESSAPLQVIAPSPARSRQPGTAQFRSAAPEREAGTSAEAAPMRPGRTYQDFLGDGGVGPVMVQLPGGAFSMGSPQAAPYFDERPSRTVKLKPFSMGKYELTFAEYDAYAKATGRALPADGGWGRGQRPVVGVSWDDARAYAQWLSDATGHRYRLPTEAEWEYAARAGTSTFYWWGNQAQANKANCFDCDSEWSGAMTAPVGSFAANPMGLHDLTGNVMEWVHDCYRDSYQGAPTDGAAVQSGTCATRVVRGGSYRSVLDNLRSARRDQAEPGARLDQIGFRLVREP